MHVIPPSQAKKPESSGRYLLFFPYSCFDEHPLCAEIARNGSCFGALSPEQEARKNDTRIGPYRASANMLMCRYEGRLSHISLYLWCNTQKLFFDQDLLLAGIH